MFKQQDVQIDFNPFKVLSTVTEFEEITKGRQGAILMEPMDNALPLVRSTTIYKKPPQRFLPVHHVLVNNNKFNNAMIEIYDSNYVNMGWHTDQAQDLEQFTSICIFSCYSDPNSPSVRVLKVKHKETKQESEYVLKHNSTITFSIDTNRQHVHKIILDNNRDPNNKWLGITFRVSNTYIQHISGQPYFYNSDKILRIATKDEKKEYYKLRAKENSTCDFVYPFIGYTISPSDLTELALNNHHC